MKFGRVLIAVDFSEASVAAAHWVARHFAADAEVVLGHVVDAPQPPTFLRGLLPPHQELVETARVGAVARLADLAAALGDIRVDTEVCAGTAAESIVALADRIRADLIAVGAHGRRRGVWSLLGSTAEQILGEARVPVLLAANLPAGAPATVLTPVDHSALTPHVLAAAGALASRFDAQLVALHVFDPLLYGRVQLVSAPRASDAAGGELRLAAEQWLEERVAEAGLDPARTTPRVALGAPGFEILAAASRHAAQLIVMGSRGESGVRRVLLGSVARAVLRGAPCPVLVLRSPKD